MTIAPDILPPLLKWIGNKHRVARAILSHLPARFGTYFEPFLGSGAVLGALKPQGAIASDALAPLIDIWQTLERDPQRIKTWYADRWLISQPDAKATYQQIRDCYNLAPNGADLLWISRSCYGGVIRFRKHDGHISTPCGIHRPIEPDTFDRRVELWHHAMQDVSFVCADFREVLGKARCGDLVYADPPYHQSQAILYGAQAFRLDDLWQEIERLKRRGVQVALSLDGSKRGKTLPVPIPDGLFKQEILIETGRSMLLRFQRAGETLEHEQVQDRLLLTY